MILTIITQRELFLLLLCTVTYVTLFIVAVQNSKRKMMQLEQRLLKAKQMQEEQQALSQQVIEENERKIKELETLSQQLGDENSLLKLQLEERRAKLAYDNEKAKIEQEKRQHAESVIFSSEVFVRMQQYLERGKGMTSDDWAELTQLVDSIYTGFTGKLYGLYQLTRHEYYVSLLIKVRIPPKDIATLTMHSKESIASTRSRLYQKVFGKKGSSKDWDEFVLSI
ncbi:MAG: hypothetical protein IJ928_11980 [Prevotella sp.]|nr:hypothetical protein [Prevotella sp.]